MILSEYGKSFGLKWQVATSLLIPRAISEISESPTMSDLFSRSPEYGLQRSRSIPLMVFESDFVGNKYVFEVRFNSRKGEPSALNRFKSVRYQKAPFAALFQFFQQRGSFGHKDRRFGEIMLVNIIELSISNEMFLPWRIPRICR